MNASGVGEAIVSILMAIIGVAIIALLVSQKSQTPQVLNAGASAFSGILNTALSPVTGGSSLGGLTNGLLNG
jgi:hypothetical protein